MRFKKTIESGFQGFAQIFLQILLNIFASKALGIGDR